jgi:hypothetical protein
MISSSYGTSLISANGRDNATIYCGNKMVGEVGGAYIDAPLHQIGIL